MERSLADLIALRSSGIELSETHMSRVASDLLSALCFLHENRIIHRDVRSDNVMLSPAGVAKLSEQRSAPRVMGLHRVLAH